MADEQYTAYCQEFGYAPKQPQHLIAFGRVRGVTINWKDANRIVNNQQTKSKKRPNQSSKSKTKAHPTYRSTQNKTGFMTSYTAKRPSAILRYQHLTQQLISMGWNEKQSTKAIVEANSNLQLAIESLMSGNVHKPKMQPHDAINSEPNALLSWLNDIGMSHYYNQFVQRGFDANISALSTLNDAQLKSMRIANASHRRIILNRAQPQNVQTQTLEQALEILSNGRASIKQRLRAMDQLYNNLSDVAIASDNGQKLLFAFTQQLLHQDYIYREYAVRKKALAQISDVFMFCLRKTDCNQSTQLQNINESMSDIMDCLFLLLDDNKAMKSHEIVRECLDNVVNAVMQQKHKNSVIDLCGMLNEKGNCENITQAHARFYAAKQIFQKILFGFDVRFVNHMFNINILDWNNKLVKYTSGIPDDEYGFPQNSMWFHLVVAQKWDNDYDETFKDIIADSVSVMMMDPNSDIATIGFNLAVYFYRYNNNFVQHLDAESKYRFSKYFTPNALKEAPENIEITEEIVDSEYSPTDMIYGMNEESLMSVNSYRIKQETPISVASPTLPDL